jgi:hypothetical protein
MLPATHAFFIITFISNARQKHESHCNLNIAITYTVHHNLITETPNISIGTMCTFRLKHESTKNFLWKIEVH